MFMLRKTHEAAMKAVAGITPTDLLGPFLLDENDALRDRLAKANARVLRLANEVDRLRPSADKWIAAQTKRRNARKVAK